MTQNPIIVSSLENIKNTYHLLMKHCIKQVPVVNNGRLIGIVTDRDLRRALMHYLKNPNLTINEVISPNPVTISEDSRLEEAARIIRKRRFNALPVVNSQRDLVGIITVTDILDGLLNFIEIRNKLSMQIGYRVRHSKKNRENT
ncbi:CBS domain-containing protein [Desulfobacterota bacterium AH_259_B03_O07]|nr:CBS domain-containing protein [Desulfobacterota bacterium AH_259_B03_O07]